MTEYKNRISASERLGYSSPTEESSETSSEQSTISPENRWTHFKDLLPGIFGYSILLIPMALCLRWYFSLEVIMVEKSTIFGSYTYDVNGSERSWAFWVCLFVGLGSLYPFFALLNKMIELFND